MKTKKMIMIGMVVLLAFSGCKKESNPTSESQQGGVESTKKNNELPTVNKVDGVKLPQIYKAPMQKIVMNVPNYQRIESGYLTMYNVGREYSIGVVYDKVDEVPKTLQAAHEAAFDIYILCMQNYARIKELEAHEEQTFTVNGIEVYEFEGLLNCELRDETPYSLYAFGYSFIMDGLPCSVIGTVLKREDPQPEEYKTEIKKTVKAMIKTLRSEK